MTISELAGLELFHNRIYPKPPETDCIVFSASALKTHIDVFIMSNTSASHLTPPQLPASSSSLPPSRGEFNKFIIFHLVAASKSVT